MHASTTFKNAPTGVDPGLQSNRENETHATTTFKTQKCPIPWVDPGFLVTSQDHSPLDHNGS